MSKYNLEALSNLPISQLADLSDSDFILATWKHDGISVLEAIDRQHITPMTNDSFISNHCYACGGDWGAMLLTGIKALYPEVYHAIPDNMGHFAWRCLCSVVTLLGITE